MKRFIVAVAVFIVVAIAIWQLGRRHRSQPNGSLGGAPAAVHTAAPNFSLPGVDGKQLDLASYRGKVVLLDFWATWCTPCREEIPRFVELQDKYREQGLQVIGISMDDGPQPVRKFYRDFKMNYPVAVGTEPMAESYGGVLGLPINFLIGRDGRIAAKYVGAVEMTVVEQAITSLLQVK